jgi:hypothetical protein
MAKTFASCGRTFRSNPAFLLPHDVIGLIYFNYHAPGAQRRMKIFSDGNGQWAIGDGLKDIPDFFSDYSL